MTADRAMKTHLNLFVGEHIRDHRKLLRSLYHKKLPFRFYFVAFCNGESRLSILYSWLFLQKFYKDQTYEVVALFKSKDEALEYIRALSEISVRKFRDFDARKTIDSLTGAELEAIKTAMEEEKE